MIIVCGGGIGGLECIKSIQKKNNNVNNKITLLEPNKFSKYKYTKL
jgi:NADH dehydrogenase FAD-containing subunit